VAEFARRYSKPNFYDRLSLHSRSHPPGPVVFQWAIWKVFGGGAGVAALLTVGFATLMVPLLYLAGRALYGDGPARLAVLLAMTTPSVVMYTVTSMEGVYACFVLAAVALHARARRAGAHAFAVAEGLALAVGTMMTYAVVFVAGMLGLWLLAEGVSRQRAWREVVGQGLGAAAGFALGWVPPLLLGYRPVATLRATFAMNTELLGSAHESLARYAATVSVNLADFAFGLGLVLAVLWSWSLARAVRRRAVDAFAVATLGAIVVMATVSVYHGETARAWMFMAPLLALLAAREAQALGETAGPRGLRALLGLAAVQLFAAEALLSTPW
jgi:4-amino-4-deoxy-L-arabinose transferase-like glycosyltransferase